MKKILQTLYSEYGNTGNPYRAENNRIAHNRYALTKSLTKYERRLLLRIIDDNALIIEKTSMDSFFNGTIIGARLMIELLHSTK